MKDLINIAIQASVDAGKEIMQIYRTGDFGIEKKADNSPLTLADKAAHHKIMEYLEKTQIPILSEEGSLHDYSKRQNWSKLWIVDPLDGTKEFVKKTGEFTVNIALIENNFPVGGVVFVPAEKTLYYGSEEGAFKAILSDNWENEAEVKTLETQKLPLPNESQSLKIVASVSHLSKETEDFANILKEKYGETEFMSVGSSIKICKVAEGSADIYPRLGPTMEWDTAAGQAVAEAAGAIVMNWNSQKRFDYNRKELLNNWFVVAGKRFTEKELAELIKNSGL